jgi:hypothetical protein
MLHMIPRRLDGEERVRRLRGHDMMAAGARGMGLFDRFKRKPLEQDGRSAATAILLPAVDAGEASAIRYNVLERLFGVRDLDWQIFQRTWSKGPWGRDIIRFDIGTRQGSDVVYFDLSDVAENAEIREAKSLLSKAAEAGSEDDLTIALPTELYLTLWKIIEEVADRFACPGFAYDFIRVTVLQAMAAHDLRSGAPLAVTLRVMDWAALGLVVGRVESADAHAHALIEALASALEMDKSRPA